MPARRASGERHDGIQSHGAETAADDEHADRTAALREARRRRWHREDLLSHGVTDGARLRACIEAVRKGFQHFARERREAAVREAGDGVLFVDDQGRAGQPGSDTAGARDESAEPDDDLRTMPPHHSQRLPESQRQLEWRREQRREAFAAQAAD